MKNNLIPPINFLCAFTKGRCPHCIISKTETYFVDRAGTKTKPLWVCNLRNDMLGHRSCTIDEWKVCPLH